jgi:hypothetical protein
MRKKNYYPHLQDANSVVPKIWNYTPVKDGIPILKFSWQLYNCWMDDMASGPTPLEVADAGTRRS